MALMAKERDEGVIEVFQKSTGRRVCFVSTVEVPEDPWPGYPFPPKKVPRKIICDDHREEESFRYVEKVRTEKAFKVHYSERISLSCCEPQVLLTVNLQDLQPVLSPVSGPVSAPVSEPVPETVAVSAVDPDADRSAPDLVEDPPANVEAEETVESEPVIEEEVALNVNQEGDSDAEYGSAQSTQSNHQQVAIPPSLEKSGEGPPEDTSSPLITKEKSDTALDLTLSATKSTSKSPLSSPRSEVTDSDVDDDVEEESTHEEVVEEQGLVPFEVDTSRVAIPEMSTKIKSFMSSISCRGCGSSFPCHINSRNTIPSPEYYYHCILRCQPYRDLGLMKQCPRCLKMLLHNGSLTAHNKGCKGRFLPPLKLNDLSYVPVVPDVPPTITFSDTPSSSSSVVRVTALPPSLEGPHEASPEKEKNNESSSTDFADTSDNDDEAQNEAKVSGNSTETSFLVPFISRPSQGKRHRSHGSFICSFPGCCSSFANMSKLNLHMDQFHALDAAEERRQKLLNQLPPNTVYEEGKDRPFVCKTSDCKWTFKEIYHLKRHHKNIHCKEGPPPKRRSIDDSVGGHSSED